MSIAKSAVVILLVGLTAAASAQTKTPRVEGIHLRACPVARGGLRTDAGAAWNEPPGACRRHPAVRAWRCWGGDRRL